MAQASDSRGRLYTRYVSTHTRRREHLPTGFQHIPVVDHLPSLRDSRILDIGCGAGELIERARSRGFRNIVGVDISEEQVALAQSLGRQSVIRADVFEYLATNNGCFNAVTATDVLEHFDRDEVMALLDAVFRALLPRGLLIAQVPNATSPFFGNYAFGDFTHRSVFTASSARQVCLATGFEHVDIYPVGPVVHGLASRLRKMVWDSYSAAFKLALASETGRLRGHLVTQNIVIVARKPG